MKFCKFRRDYIWQEIVVTNVPVQVDMSEQIKKIKSFMMFLLFLCGLSIGRNSIRPKTVHHYKIVVRDIIGMSRTVGLVGGAVLVEYKSAWDFMLDLL